MERKIWEQYGLDRLPYQALPWRTKRCLLIKAEVVTNWRRIYIPTFHGWWIDLKLWWNRPPGGYLFDAGAKDKAERETIKWKYGKRVSYLDLK